MPDVEVLPIPRGSIILMRDVLLCSPVDGVDAQEYVANELARACGHDEFLIMWTTGSGADVQIMGDDDLMALVRAAVDRVIDDRIA